MFKAGLIPSPGWKYPAWSVADQSQAPHLLVIGPALQTTMSYKAGTYELPKVPAEAILHAGWLLSLDPISVGIKTSLHSASILLALKFIRLLRLV